MMIVVVIIGLFAALAAPSVLSLVKDQRARRQAIAVVDVLREARARSLGRGAAIDVNYLKVDPAATWDATQSGFIVKEAFSGPGNLPSPSCGSTNWAAGGPWTELSHLLPGAAKEGSGVQIIGSYASDTATVKTSTNLDVCFTPSGRVFYRDGGSFLPLQGFVTFTVQRKDPVPIGVIRTVQLNADGVTKVLL